MKYFCSPLPNFFQEIIYLRQLYKQQLAAASIEGATAKRYFNAVQGDSKR